MMGQSAPRKSLDVLYKAGSMAACQYSSMFLMLARCFALYLPFCAASDLPPQAMHKKQVKAFVGDPADLLRQIVQVRLCKAGSAKEAM